jgi:EAL domain-containing protein (putative c-di-GMP-specific phosphodiesterase class I)
MTENNTISEKFAAGQVIFEEGEIGDCAYIIESGRVQVYIDNHGEELPLKVFGVGEIFGEMAVIDAQARSASAKALSDCQLVVVSSSQISERINESDPIVKLLISILLQRMRNVNQQTKTLNMSNVKPFDLTNREDLSQEISDQLDEKRNNILDKMKLETELQQALQFDEFVPYYQPIFNIKTNEFLGFESLIRWQSPSRGMVPPNVFIDLAEETSLIVPIGKWSLRTACRDLARMKRQLEAKGYKAGDKLFVSVNLSGRQFLDPEFFNDLEGITSQYEISPRQIKLEVTERVFMQGKTAINAIAKCREMGFHVSLDDFGTGYSSLSYLAQFEVDSLKIDQAFVRKMFDSKKNQSLITAIINMCKGLNIPTIAEGVETEEQREHLESLGANLGQGYLISRPLPYDEAVDKLIENIESRKKITIVAS